MSDKIYTRKECIDAVTWYQENVDLCQHKFQMIEWGGFFVDGAICRVGHHVQLEDTAEITDMHKRFSCGTAGCLSGTIGLFHGDREWWNGTIKLEGGDFGNAVAALFMEDRMSEQEVFDRFWQIVEETEGLVGDPDNPVWAI